MPNFQLTKIIERKKNGKELSTDEIAYFVDSVVNSAKSGAGAEDAADRAQIDYYSVSELDFLESFSNFTHSNSLINESIPFLSTAWKSVSQGAMLMAIYLKGFNSRETTDLTHRMKNSGYVFSWPDAWQHLVVDKHSTGGVGDKVSLVLAPVLAALGLKVPMISGRSLGHTGGTLDKLESIPGYRIHLTKEEIYNIIDSVGCCIVGQTDDCVPADKVLYQCREITATTNCSPLIIASIVSKKLSEGPNTLVYDVKYGKGSVFRSKEEAIDTAKKLIETSIDVNASAVLTSMENPLGKSIGNSLEVLEAIECLQGTGQSDVLEVTYALGCQVLRHVQRVTVEEGERLISSVLINGQALEKFHDMLLHQGVDREVAGDLCYGNAASILPKSQNVTDISFVGTEGYIHEIDPLVLASWCKEEYFRSSHRGVGITLLKTVEDKIQTGEVWMRVHHHCNHLSDEIIKQLQNALSVHSHQYKRTVVSQIFN